jgi:hypothetical protein
MSLVFLLFSQMAMLFSTSRVAAIHAASVPLPAPTHKVYTSLTTIEYVASEELMGISIRLFSDDLEAALERSSQAKIDIETPKGELALRKYLATHLSVKTPSSKHLAAQFISYKTDIHHTDVVLAYDYRKGDDLLVSNTLLIELFENQLNSVHVLWGKEKTSHVFNLADTEYLFQYPR